MCVYYCISHATHALPVELVSRMARVETLVISNTSTPPPKSFLLHHSQHNYFNHGQALTASIVIGWSLLVVTFGQFSSLGYPAGVLGGAAALFRPSRFRHISPAVLLPNSCVMQLEGCMLWHSD